MFAILASIRPSMANYDGNVKHLKKSLTYKNNSYYKIIHNTIKNAIFHKFSFNVFEKYKNINTALSVQKLKLG